MLPKVQMPHTLIKTRKSRITVAGLTFFLLLEACANSPVEQLGRGDQALITVTALPPPPTQPPAPSVAVPLPPTWPADSAAAPASPRPIAPPTVASGQAPPAPKVRQLHCIQTDSGGEWCS